MDDLHELFSMIVSDSVCDTINEFLDEFEKEADRRNPGLDLARITQDGEVCIFKFETPDKAMAIVKKDGRYAVDLNAYDPKSGLLEISKEHYDKLLERAYALEKKYSSYNVVTTGELDDMLAGTTSVPRANSEQDDEMLDTCMKILETIDGKKKHYSNLNHKSYGHVTIVLDGDDFVAALTCSKGAACGNTQPNATPLKYSPAVTEAMRTTYKVINEKLPNSLPENMREVLPLISARFNALSDEEKQRIIRDVRNRKH